MNPDGTTYFPGGRPIEPATIVRLPRLAEALESCVELGAEFLDGPVGEAIVRTVVDSRREPRPTTDLAGARAEWAAVRARRSPGRYGVGDPGTDPRTVAARRRRRAREPGEPAGVRYHAVLAAIARRRELLADPSGTSMVSAADIEGNVVVVVHSNSFPRFGSGIVVPEYDLVLANRAGRGFTPTPGPSELPGSPDDDRRRRCTRGRWPMRRSTAAARGDTRRGEPDAVERPEPRPDRRRVRSPGELVTSPLWEWLPEDDGLRVEGGFSDETLDSLRAAAPRISGVPRWGCKSAQQVVAVARPGEAYTSAADPRTVGARARRLTRRSPPLPSTTGRAMPDDCEVIALFEVRLLPDASAEALENYARYKACGRAARRPLRRDLPDPRRVR